MNANRREFRRQGTPALPAALRDAGKTEIDLGKEPKNVPWKIAMAARLREQVAAPYPWLVHVMSLGHPTTLRSSVWRLRTAQRATA